MQHSDIEKIPIVDQVCSGKYLCVNNALMMLYVHDLCKGEVLVLFGTYKH